MKNILIVYPLKDITNDTNSIKLLDDSIKANQVYLAKLIVDSTTHTKVIMTNIPSIIAFIEYYCSTKGYNYFFFTCKEANHYTSSSKEEFTSLCPSIIDYEEGIYNEFSL